MQGEELYLQDIIEAVAAIEDFLQNVEKADFLASRLLQSAVVHQLMIIGEASARLADERKSLYPQTPWKQIVGLRNIVAHAYFSIDYESVWSTGKSRPKPLDEEVLKILQNDFPDFELRSK